MIFSSLSQTLLFLLPASLILALEKVTFFGVPVYFLEALFVAFVLISAWQVTRVSIQARWKGFDRWVALGAVLFILGAALSTLYNEISLTSLGQFKSWFLFPLVFFVTLYSFRVGNYREREIFYRAWLAGLVIIALVSLYGYSQHILTYDGRLAFPYSSANFLALLVAPGVFLATFLLYKTNTWPKKLPFFFLGGSLSATLYLTHSYNTWLATMMGVIIVALIAWLPKAGSEYRHQFTIFAIGLILFIGTFFFLEQGNSKWQNLFLENGRSSWDSRMMIWQSSSGILRENWFLGIGVGNFQREYLANQLHFTPYLEWAVPQPHNLILAVWLQTGLMGLLGFVLMAWRLVSLLVVTVFRALQKENPLEGVLLAGLWILFLFYGLFDTPYFRNDLAFLFWLQVLLTYWYVQEKN